MPLISRWSFRFRRLLGVVLGAAAMAPGFSATETKRSVPTDRPVNYEAFGAVGDGVADDMPAIEFFKPPVSDLALFNADWNPAVLSVSSAVSLAIWPRVACQSMPYFPFTLAKK